MPPLLGQLVLFPYNVPPLGRMLCDGSLISIAEDEPLFQLLGGFASKSELFLERVIYEASFDVKNFLSRLRT